MGGSCRAHSHIDSPVCVFRFRNQQKKFKIQIVKKLKRKKHRKGIREEFNLKRKSVTRKYVPAIRGELYRLARTLMCKIRQCRWQKRRSVGIERESNIS